MNRGLSQGVLVDQDTNLTQFGFHLRSLTGAAEDNVKFMVWNSSNTASLFSQALTLAPIPDQGANPLLVLANPFEFALQAGTVYHFGLFTENLYQPRTFNEVAAISDNGFTTSGRLQLYNNFENPTHFGNGSGMLALQLRGSSSGDGPPDAVVPEPITMVLLGTGLAGIAAVRRRRRTLG